MSNVSPHRDQIDEETATITEMDGLDDNDARWLAIGAGAFWGREALMRVEEALRDLEARLKMKGADGG